jgi:redox-sensing transcriptional repressor
MSEVVLFSRPRCGLCDEAREVILEVQHRVPFDLREVDISGRDDLELEYGIRIPVVLVDGEEIAEIRLDPSDLEAALGPQPRGAGRPATAYHRVVTDRAIPEATVGRLPLYLRALTELAEAGTTTVSSEILAEATGVNSSNVRKDLSHVGSYGTRGVGYDVSYLLHQIRRELGLTQHWPIVIAGIGNLGHALANYRGFGERGFRAAALVDNDPAKIGERVGDLRVRPIEDLPAIAREHSALIGVICTPAAAAQAVADAMVVAGIASILNFAPVAIVVPDGVSVRKVDLAIELQILTYYEQRKTALSELTGSDGARSNDRERG